MDEKSALELSEMGMPDDIRGMVVENSRMIDNTLEWAHENAETARSLLRKSHLGPDVSAKTPLTYDERLLAIVLAANAIHMANGHAQLENALQDTHGQPKIRVFLENLYGDEEDEA